MIKFNKLLLLAISISLVSFAANSAIAGEPGETALMGDGQYISGAPNGKTGVTAQGTLVSKPLILRQNMVEVIEVSSDIGSIMLSDPAPVELIVESSRRIVLRPAEPGVTNLTIINKGGQVVYKRDIVVTQRGENYVRVKRYCDDQGCTEEDIYYCPYGCYGVKSTRENAAGFAPVSTVSGGSVQDTSRSAPGAYPQPTITTGSEWKEIE